MRTDTRLRKKGSLRRRESSEQSKTQRRSGEPMSDCQIIGTIAIPDLSRQRKMSFYFGNKWQQSKELGCRWPIMSAVLALRQRHTSRVHVGTFTQQRLSVFKAQALSSGLTMTTSSTSQNSAPDDSRLTGAEPDRRLTLSLALQGPDSLLECLSNPQLELATAIPCSAAAVAVNGEVVSLRGDCEHQALKLLPGLDEKGMPGIYHSDTQLVEKTQETGVLAISFCPPEKGWLLWFRDAQKAKASCWSAADITAAAELRADMLEASLQREAMATRVQQSLITRLGHDLSNPLQSITMSAALLRPQSQRDSELSKLILAAGKKMERLLAQIRDLNHLQSGKQIHINPVETDISALVNAVLEDEHTLHPELVIQAQIEPGIKAKVDAQRYVEVIAHLLSNASQQCQPGTPTVVGLETAEDGIQLTISSQIEPLSAEQMAGLFQPVANDGLMRDQNGLGMGLYICAAIVQAHDGSVGAEQVDGSITFCLTLPRLGS